MPTFLSTPSARRATTKQRKSMTSVCNFYPRPPRGGRLLPRLPEKPYMEISIHALREEGDRGPGTPHRPLGYFYPRPPRGGRPGGLRQDRAPADFYPRPPRGGRHDASPTWEDITQFLSTPSARRATVRKKADGGILFKFLSTPSARRATAKTETKSLFSYKLYNILHEFRRALIYNGSKNYPNHAKQLKNLVRRCRKNAENSLFAPGRETQNNSRPSCSKGG